MCATSVINQDEMTVRCEFVNEAKMRISKFYDGCFHELVEKLFVCVI